MACSLTRLVTTINTVSMTLTYCFGVGIMIWVNEMRRRFEGVPLSQTAANIVRLRAALNASFVRLNIVTIRKYL